MQVLVTNFNPDDFLKTRFVSGAFLQSSIWKIFLLKQTKQIFNLAITDDDQIVATCLLYENKLPFGFSYLYAPKGPIFLKDLNNQKKQEATALILSKVRDICIKTKQQEEVFCKTETEDAPKDIKEFKKSEDIQPRATWILDLIKTKEELLQNMHPKTRYNINLARRKGVGVRFSEKTEDINIFLKLIKKTATKNQITVHSDQYYKLLCQSLFEQGVGSLAIAEAEDHPLAANIIIRFGESTTYLHGASDYDRRQYMAPHLLQWETIRQSQDLGYKIYDFWGINPSDDSKPQWVGITRFKKSFGGQMIESAGAYDFIYQIGAYQAYTLAKKIRRIIKR